MEPFHIVWFDDAHKEQAMRSLALLPATEHAARGKFHHFRSWASVPTPKAGTGVDRGKCLQCVCTDHRGSACLSPGAIYNDDLCIRSFCDEIREIEPGFMAAYIKADTWTRLEFIKEAKQVEEQEKALLAKRRERLHRATRDAFGHFFISVANEHRLKSGPVCEEHAPYLAPLEKEGGVDEEIQRWLDKFDVEIVADAQAPEYDPVSFLDHASTMLSSAQNFGKPAPVYAPSDPPNYDALEEAEAMEQAKDAEA